MSANPNRLSRFWQELKRRKVTRTITVNAAAAFVILELVDIITEPFGLPEWTLKFVFVLLCVGFLIIIIFSWIYDLTPEGMEKTKPIKDIQRKEKTAFSPTWPVLLLSGPLTTTPLPGITIISMNQIHPYAAL